VVVLTEKKRFSAKKRHSTENRGFTAEGSFLSLAKQAIFRGYFFTETSPLALAFVYSFSLR